MHETKFKRINLGQVQVLVCSDHSTKKAQDAAKRGIAVVDEAWLDDQLDGGGSEGGGSGPSKKKQAKGKAEGPGPYVPHRAIILDGREGRPQELAVLDTEGNIHFYT